VTEFLIYNLSRRTTKFRVITAQGRFVGVKHILWLKEAWPRHPKFFQTHSDHAPITVTLATKLGVTYHDQAQNFGCWPAPTKGWHPRTQICDNILNCHAKTSKHGITMTYRTLTYQDHAINTSRTRGGDSKLKFCVTRYIYNPTIYHVIWYLSTWLRCNRPFPVQRIWNWGFVGNKR